MSYNCVEQGSQKHRMTRKTVSKQLAFQIESFSPMTQDDLHLHVDYVYKVWVLTLTNLEGPSEFILSWSPTQLRKSNHVVCECHVSFLFLKHRTVNMMSIKTGIACGIKWTLKRRLTWIIRDKWHVMPNKDLSCRVWHRNKRKTDLPEERIEHRSPWRLIPLTILKDMNISIPNTGVWVHYD